MMVIFAVVWLVCAGATYALGRSIKQRRELRVVQVVEDTEQNLGYRIEIARAGHEWFFRLDACRRGNSTVTGALTVGDTRLEIAGLPDNAAVEVGCRQYGGPALSQEAALADALRALETLR